MKHTVIGILLILLTGGAMAGCGGGLSPTGAPAQPSAVKTEPPSKPAKAAWEEKWSKVLADGQKERVVTLYTHWTPEVRIALSQALKEKYGITLEFTLFSGGSDLLARVQTEKRAGLNIVDVIGTGATSLVTSMKPAGILGSIEPVIILPEVTDSKAWGGGEFPYMDKDKMSVAMIGLAMRDIVYNTDLVKEGELSTPGDLLKPQYKGKIVLHDPSTGGSGNGSVSQVANILGLEGAMDWFRQLLRNEPFITRDYRLHLEGVSRGKYAIGIGADSLNLVNFMNIGAPVSIAVYKEGAMGTASAGALGVPTISPHPNATAVFVNWLLGKEGQSALARAMQQPSRRVDASTEGVIPIFLPKPGEKVYWENQDTISRKAVIMQRTKAIMEEFQK